MFNFSPPRGLRIFAGISLLAAVSVAQAQYVWVDSKGVRQFSDRPPPTDVPLNKIIKAPNLPKAALIPTEAPAAAAASASAAASDPKAKLPQTLAEKNAEFKKRQKEKEEQEEKLVKEREQKKAKDETCAAIRAQKAQMESGDRVSRTDKNGEKSYLTDQERAAQAAKAGKHLAACD
jgi:hypothetical protein